MPAATDVPTPFPASWTSSWDADVREELERLADRSICLHLPADECDHAVFRCLRCCPHPT